MLKAQQRAVAAIRPGVLASKVDSVARSVIEKAGFGNCDIEIVRGEFEPPAEVRGDIARIYFYMDWAYPAYDLIAGQDRKLFKTWDQQDPVDEWECERAGRIEEIQKNENPFVKKACVSEGLW